MKSIQWKSFTLGIVFTLLLTVGFGTALAAGPINKTIKVLYNDIKIAIDGKQAVLGKDSAGNEIEPFIYNGTTYLPVRGVSEALGERVHWDGKTQTVYIGERPGEVKYLTEINPPYAWSEKVYYLNNPEKIKMGGKSYNTAITFDYSSHALINLNSQYNELSFNLGTTKYRYLTTSKLNVYLDGEFYKTFEISVENLPEKVVIPVKGVNQIKFLSENSYNNHEFAIGDPILK